MESDSNNPTDLAGVFPAIFTPFDKENRVNMDMLSRIAEFQLSHGVNGFFVCGSTGEGLLLSEQERNSVVQHLVSEFGDQATIIAHVGHPSTDVASRLAKSAADAGADWISSVGPIYYGGSFEAAMRHYQAIATATDLPFMIYSLNNEIVPDRDAKFFELPNVQGIKYTGANYFSVQQLACNVGRKVTMVSGMDEHFAGALAFGFDGGIGSTYNFAPHVYVKILQAYRDNNIHLAAQLQRDMNRVTSLMIEYENWSYRKAFMRYIGFDCGPARGPYAPLSEEEFESLSARIEEIGFLERRGQ